MAATQDTTCALIERAHERHHEGQTMTTKPDTNKRLTEFENARRLEAGARLGLEAVFDRFANALDAQARMVPQNAHIVAQYQAVESVLDTLIEHGAIVTRVEIASQARITLHRAPPRDYATGNVVVRRGLGGRVVRNRRVLLDGVHVEWPEASA